MAFWHLWVQPPAPEEGPSDGESTHSTTFLTNGVNNCSGNQPDSAWGDMTARATAPGAGRAVIATRKEDIRRTRSVRVCNQFLSS